MLKLLLLLFKGAKLGKLALTGGTMLLSVIAYAWIFGWWYAVGFVGLIFVHEMGHYLAARQRGLDVGAPTFIPFVGAWIELKQRPHDAETEAWIGLAGPLVGSLGALACYFAARASGSPSAIANTRACWKCWYGPELMPNQPSLVTLTSQPGRSPGGTAAPGKIAS